MSRQFYVIDQSANKAIKMYVTCRVEDEADVLALLNSLTDDRTTVVTLPVRHQDWAKPTESDDEDGDDEMGSDDGEESVEVD